MIDQYKYAGLCSCLTIMVLYCTLEFIAVCFFLKGLTWGASHPAPEGEVCVSPISSESAEPGPFHCIIVCIIMSYLVARNQECIM